MIFAIEQDGFNADDRKAGEQAVFGRFDKAFFNGGEIVFRNGSAENRLFKDIGIAATRPESHLDDAIETAAAGLFDIAARGCRFAFDRFAVGNFRSGNIDLNAEDIFDALQNIVEVRVA